MSLYLGDNLIAPSLPNAANQSLSNLNATGEKHFVNKTQITDCILEAPNGVVTYSGSYFTVKAGVKVLIPNGRNADGTLNNIEYTLPEDSTWSQAVNLNNAYPRYIRIFAEPNGNGDVVSSCRMLPPVNGDLPSTVPDTNTWAIYDEATNYYYATSGSTTANWKRDSLQATVGLYSGNDSSDYTKITALTAYQPLSVAKREDLDGGWAYSYVTMLSNVSINANTVRTVDLSSYLPNDGNIYEVLIKAIGSSSATSGNSIRLCAYSDIMTSNASCELGYNTVRSNASVSTSGSAVCLVGAKRVIYFINHGNATVSNIYFSCVGYRRVH